MTRQNPSDEADFGRLFVRFEPRIYGFIRSLVPNRSDAEELLQETASVLWKKFDEYEPGTNFLAWAIQVARYQVLYFRQRQARDVLRFSDEFIDAVADDTVAAAVKLGELQQALSDCLRKLGDKDRELFVRRYRWQRTTRELAAELRRPASTVYNALNRIRRALYECIQGRLGGEILS